MAEVKTLTVQDKIKLLQPICYLNSSERYFPMTLDTYLDNCKIKKGEKVEDLKLDTIDSYKDDKSYQLIPQGPTNYTDYPERNSAFLGNSDINNVPFYVKINGNEKGYTDILFFFFYGYNGSVATLFDLLKIGSHYSDLEHIMIRVDTTKYNAATDTKSMRDAILNIYYSAHSGGRMMKPSDVYWENNHVIVYIANRTHASYPNDGLYVRFYGFGNDHVEKYYRWYPNENFIIGQSTNTTIDNFILNYKGNMGYDHVTAFAGKSFFNGGDEEIVEEGFRVNPILYNSTLVIMIATSIYFLVDSYYKNNKIMMGLLLVALFVLYNLKTVHVI